MNAELEHRVEERTADLLQANKALRQFAIELSESDRHKDEFLAMLAHELRNPLAPIRNALQILRLSDGDGEAVQCRDRDDGTAGGPDGPPGGRPARREPHQSRQDRASQASGSNWHRPSTTPSKPLARLRIRMGHELNVALPPQPVYLNADPIRLAQLVGNLLNNACKFTAKGGRISLIVEQDE